MIFDPFGDFETRGYLRNHAGEKDTEIVKRLEHSSFLTGVDEAFAFLSSRRTIGYNDVLEVHRILFDAVYPWAGQDRTLTAPGFAIKRGPVLFAHPGAMRIAVEYGLRRGNDADGMRDKPGEVMGYLAHGHPFLDGNGRALMVVHTVLAERAGISIDWAATDKGDYLRALTLELDEPGKGHLDRYLDQYAGAAVGSGHLVDHVVAIPGLDSSAQSFQTNEVAGPLADPALQARYEQQELKYQQAQLADDLAKDRDHEGSGY